MNEIKQAEAAWLPQWTAAAPEVLDQSMVEVRQLLDSLPAFPEHAFDISWTADALMRIAKRVIRKASGPDHWTAAVAIAHRVVGCFCQIVAGCTSTWSPSHHVEACSRFYDSKTEWRSSPIVSSQRGLKIGG